MQALGVIKGEGSILETRGLSEGPLSQLILRCWWPDIHYSRQSLGEHSEEPKGKRNPPTNAGFLVITVIMVVTLIMVAYLYK